jgi:hypothetical protein
MGPAQLALLLAQAGAMAFVSVPRGELIDRWQVLRVPLTPRGIDRLQF